MRLEIFIYRRELVLERKMVNKKLLCVCLGILLLSVSIVSASWLGDFYNRVTGKEPMLSTPECWGWSDYYNCLQ